MVLREFFSILETIAPLRYAEPWDNVGLLAGDPGATVNRVLLTIDLTHAVLSEAIRQQAQLVVAYHPPVFKPLQRIAHDSVLHRAIREDLALWSPHTALDVAPGGTNDVLADALGLVDRAPLRLTVPAEGLGIGRVGVLPAPLHRTLLFARIKQVLGLNALLVAGPSEGEVSRVAVCAGAGRELVHDVLANQVELYLTGELPHYDALQVAAAGVTVACALHSNSERATLHRVALRLQREALGVEIRVSLEDRDPFEVR